MSSRFEILQRQQWERDLAAAQQVQERQERERERRQQELATAQAAARAERERRREAWEEADRKEREEQEARREKARQERTQAAAAELKTRLRAVYLEQPGATPEGFEREWPELLRRHQVEQTLATPLDLVERTKAELRELRRGHYPPLVEPACAEE